MQKHAGKSNEQIAVKASLTTIVADIFLVTFKMFAGIVGRSTAMVADAVHSLADMLTTIVVIVGVKMANRKADKEHPYGHERFECVAAIILSVILFVTGGGIGWAGLQQIIAWDYADIPVPGIIALVAAVVTIVVKEAMYWYKRAAAKRVDSSALMADAWHHRIDALTSIGSFLGILGARLGFPILDPLAALLICLFIFKAAFGVFKDTISKMTDRACDDETENEMRQTILSQETVVSIDLLKTRLFGDKIYVDVEISVKDSETLRAGHDAAHQVRDAIETGFPKVKHCTVHINPVTDSAHILDEEKTLDKESE